jgi:pimeloyl-ACP methyl ester carboxylesterase
VLTREFLDAMLKNDARAAEFLQRAGRGRDVPENLMDNVSESKAASLVQNPKGEAPRPITCKKLQELTIPVLLVCGENSPRFVSYIQDKLELCLQNKERVTLSNTSHGLHYSHSNLGQRILLRRISRRPKLPYLIYRAELVLPAYQRIY